MHYLPSNYNFVWSCKNAFLRPNMFISQRIKSKLHFVSLMQYLFLSAEVSVIHKPRGRGQRPAQTPQPLQVEWINYTVTEHQLSVDSKYISRQDAGWFHLHEMSWKVKAGALKWFVMTEISMVTRRVPSVHNKSWWFISDFFSWNEGEMKTVIQNLCHLFFQANFVDYYITFLIRNKFG